MKYEMIFGEQLLFDGAPDDIVAVRLNNYKRISHGYLTKEKLGALSVMDLIAIPIVAMRRIIKTPKRWTVEDQKAGRLPEVGAKYTYDGVEVTCHHINKAGDIWGHTKNGDVWCQSINEITPIETPAEKAQRERDAWARKASEFIDDELDCVNLVGEHVMRRFYNAMLSGDLPVPVAPEQNK